MAPELVLHVLPPSHPCMTATAALRLKGLEYERVEFVPGPHVEQMREIEIPAGAFPAGWVPASI